MDDSSEAMLLKGYILESKREFDNASRSYTVSL